MIVFIIVSMIVVLHIYGEETGLTMLFSLSLSLSYLCEKQIRDLDTGKIVHTLGVSGLKMSRVACHPSLPILASTLDDGTVCLWDASTYK